MTEPITQPPKLLKTMLILVAAFFLLVIMFNLWIRSSLKESKTDIKLSTTITAPVSTTGAVKKPSKFNKETTEESALEYEDMSGVKKGELLLQ
ncbi:MAG: hypothetical protein ABH954_03260 [Candidatus Omnitrophota bacterium]